MGKKKCILLTALLLANLCFGIRIKGETNIAYNSERDSVYVAAIWHYADTAPHAASAESGEIQSGKFNFEIQSLPPEEALLKKEGVTFSVAYLILFKDRNSNGKFDNKVDKIVGVAESNCLTYLQGNMNLFLDKVEKEKNKKITRLRKVAQGMQLADVLKPERQQQKNYFDDLETIEWTEIFIRSAPGEDLIFPNWT